MNVQLTIEDFPDDRKNCGNCTRKAGICPRKKKSNPNGYVMNSVTGEVGGIIYCCPHYTGPFETPKPEQKQQPDLFPGEGYVEPVKPTKFCRTCANRERWQCGGTWIQYCGVRKSKRTKNGLLKIKVTLPACALYKEENEPQNK